MSNVNFASEFRLMMRYAKDNSLSSRQRMLWIALFYIANDRAVYDEATGKYAWPDDYFFASNSEVGLYSGMDKRAIETTRNQLAQMKLIQIIPGEKNRRNPAYRLRYLSENVGYIIVPNDVPNHVPKEGPKHVPNHTPNHSPIPRYDIDNGADIQKVLGIDEEYRTSPRARAKAAALIRDEILARGLLGSTSCMHESIADGLARGFTPGGVIAAAAGSGGDWAAFAAHMQLGKAE